MRSEARMLLAVVASIGIFYVWSRWFAPEPPPPAPAPEQPVATAPAAGPTPSLPAAGALPGEVAPALEAEGVKDPQAEIPSQEITIKTKRAEITLSNAGAVPISWKVYDYETGEGEYIRPVDLVTSKQIRPLSLKLEGLGALVPALPQYQVVRQDDSQVQFVWRSKDIELRKSYDVAAGGYTANVTIELTNRGSTPLQGRLGLNWEAVNPPEEKRGMLGFIKGPPDRWHPVYYSEGSVEREENTEKLSSGLIEQGGFSWAGLENRYFLASILPRERSAQGRMIAGRQVLAGGLGDSIAIELSPAPIVLPAGGKVKQEFTIYVGPKEIEALKAAGGDLSEAINYGIFTVIAVPILYLLKFFYALIHNYGIAIILLTLLIKVLLHPITKASLKSMRRMQLLQPEIKAIREKHKGDKEKLNTETMQLFKRHKVNPMGGCLPMLLQIPVYIALYKVLWNSVELYRAPFFWFYTDLSMPDPYFISPVLLGVAFFLQQKFTPSPSADPTQRKMMMFMPIMFTGFMFFLPSGLVIYILVNTVFSVVQQWLMNRGLGFRDLFRGNLKPRNTPLAS